MLTIRQVREAVGALIHRMPEAALPPELPEQCFGNDRILEATIAENLAHLLNDQGELDPAIVPHLKLRLRFAAECLRQTEEDHPELGIEGADFPKVLRHWMIHMWPAEGEKWMMATFGPRLRVR